MASTAVALAARAVAREPAGVRPAGNAAALPIGWDCPACEKRRVLPGPEEWDRLPPGP